jgi:hypothetical protein
LRHAIGDGRHSSAYLGCVMATERTSRREDLSGQRFGSLVVEKPMVERTARRQRRWLCRCDCGGTRVVVTAKLTTGRVRKCRRCTVAAMQWSAEMVARQDAKRWRKVEMFAATADYDQTDLELGQPTSIYLPRDCWSKAG